MRGVKKICYYFIFLIPFLFPSCALLVNKKFQTIHISCDSTIKLIKVTNSTKILDLDSMPAYLVKRNANALPLEFRLRDSSIVKYRLPSELSPAFTFGNFYPIFPIGHTIDLFYPNKFRYHPNNYFSYDTIKQKIVYSGFLPVDQKYIDTKIGWSYLNTYHNSMFNSFDGDLTPLGLNLQLEYAYKKNRSIAFETGIATTIANKRRPYFSDEKPPDSVIYNHSNNYWFLLSYKYRYNKLSVGAGISFAPSQSTNEKYYITQRDTIILGSKDSTYNLVSSPKISDQNLQKIGLAFNIDYNPFSIIHIGMNWHLFFKDMNKSSGIYSSHFFNFYISIRLYRLNLNKTKSNYEYN